MNTCTDNNIYTENTISEITRQIIETEELFRQVRCGEECSFHHNGIRYIVYEWSQCDGDFLNVSDENGNIIWQADDRDRDKRAERFIEAYNSNTIF